MTNYQWNQNPKQMIHHANTNKQTTNYQCNQNHKQMIHHANTNKQMTND